MYDFREQRKKTYDFVRFPKSKVGGHGPLGNAWCTVPVLLFQLPVICKSEGGKRSVLFLQFLQEMLIQPQDKIIR